MCSLIVLGIMNMWVHKYTQVPFPPTVHPRLILLLDRRIIPSSSPTTATTSSTSGVIYSNSIHLCRMR